MEEFDHLEASTNLIGTVVEIQLARSLRIRKARVRKGVTDI
jgi:hypothetical protein